MKKISSLLATLVLISSFAFAQITPQWISVYDGPTNSSDIVFAIATDASGNTYLTGQSYNGINNDFVTVKYNSSGVQQWASTYNGPANESDIPTAIAIDASGNVYVTGSSFTGVSNDYATVAYDNNGVELWSHQFDGPDNGNDAGHAIAVNGIGEVFVTGNSVVAGNVDYLTIKYNNSGALQWFSTFNGAGNFSDFAVKVAVDGSGNAYVTGMSDNGINFDFATVKYNGAGAQQWASVYNGSANFDDYVRDLFVDGSGNVYAGGEISTLATGQDYATVKYDNTGNEIFTAIYSETPTSAEVAYAMTVDASGNIYMTGFSQDAGISSNATVKFNSSGVQQWSGLYAGIANDYGTAIAVDGSGNVFVTGVTTTALESDNVNTIKYDINGTQQWIGFYNGTDDNGDVPVGIALDASGNVYVAAQVVNLGTSIDYVVIKYASVPLSATQSQTDLTCNAVCDGTATVVASGGIAPYTYSWTSGGTAAIETGLCAGNYTCTITDANADFIDVIFTITEPVALSSVNAQTNISCFGETNGTATVTVSGGTAPYTYDWTGTPTGDGTNAVSDLTAGNYTCTITDASGCILSETFTITQPLVLSVVRSGAPVSCFGGSDGIATVTVSGGTPAYSYSWAPSGGTAATASGLTADSYTCTITDANGCSIQSTFNIPQPPPMNSSPGQTDVTCNGAADGTAFLTAFGGIAPYSYLWAPTGGTTSAETGLAQGTYTCTITDSKGCIFNQLFFITEPPALSDAPLQTNISCNGNSDGSITVNISGGTAPYTYSWAPNGETTATISSLATGIYTCTTTDANSCVFSETFTITEPTALSATTSQIDNTCNGGNSGSASVIASGGTPAYSYAWTPSGGTAATESSLTAGIYTCTITDANSCVLTETFTITEPAGMSAASSQTDVACNGGNTGSASVVVSGGAPAYTYAWTPSGGTGATASSLTAGNYTCTITDAGTCTFTVTFNITEPAPLSSTNMQTNIICNGGNTGDATVIVSGGTSPYTYAWTPAGGTAATASSLTVGNYTCTITDANSCILSETFLITEPAAALSSTNMQINISCNGGNSGDATVMVSGGTPAYSYSWAPSGGTATTAFSLTAGNYTCTITDANGCILSETFLITEPAALSSANMQTNISCNGGNTGDATVTISGGTPAYTYTWAPSGGSAATASGLSIGTYTCTITDANSCVLTETFNITEPTALTSTQSQTDVTCNGNADGTASVVASGGTPAYTYAWMLGGGTSATASSLEGGSYTCTITDANGCSTTATFTIGEPATLLATSTQTNSLCNGGNTGSATVSVIGGTPTYTYAWSPSGGSAATASSLTAGNYICTVTDANGCSTTATVTITEPTGITASTTQADISCNGNTNGSASVLASGGTPGYTYFWLPSGGTASTASSLGTGTYTCTITDANGCSIDATVTITEPAALTTTNSQTDVSCNASADGTATVVVSGGAPAYTYSWFPTGGFAATATGLSAGSYTCTITDASSCFTTATFTITEPAVLTSTSLQTDITCNGAADGTATVVVSGGTPAYTYAWMPSGGTAATASGLSPGSYTCTITDANGCITNATFTITEPATITVSNAGQTNVTCFGGNDGTATVFASGGTGILTYDWTPGTPPGDGTVNVTGLTAGTWTCTVTDANGCSATQTFAITESPALSVTSSQTNISCNGGTNGSATVVVSGGAPAYSYVWTPSGGTAATENGLSNGTYTCTITDANTCTVTATFNITEPAVISSVNTQTDVACFGGNNGTATVMVSGGTSPYTYAWAPSGGTAATASGLTFGSYTCTITDANTCSTTATFTITQAPALSVTSSQTNVSCFGGPNGTATVVVSGGTPAYTYAWMPTGGTAATATGLTAGTYTCLITDASACSFSQTFSITQPSVITTTGTQTNVSCFGGSDASATVTVSGGTPAYTYAWAPTGGTAATASGLIAGSYTVTVTDANLCTTTQSFTITAPPAIATTGTQTDASCFGGSNGSATVAASGGTSPYTYAWTPSGGNAATASSLTAGIYTCTITDANLCTTTATFNIIQPSAITFTSSQTNVSCNAGNNGTATVVVAGGTPSYTYAWSPSGGNAATATGLIAGSYTCTITDANLCTTTATFTITQPSVLTVSSTQTNVSCFGGSDGIATVIAAGGTPAYSYAWAPTGGTSATATGLSIGTYICTITDANGCIVTRTVTITQPALLTATTTSVNASCFGGTNGQATVIASGGTAAYSYAWSPTGGTTMTEFNLAAGSYTCLVTDANGCTISQTVTITEPTPITTSVTQTDLLCFGGTNGSAGVVATGGIPGYTYLWTPGGSTSATVNGLAAGSYTCTITDANGCMLAQGFNITQPNILAASVTITNVVCQGGGDGTALVSVTGGTLNYNFSWLPTGGTDSLATGLSAGTYTCSITDAHGCSLTTTATIAEPSPINVTPSHTNVTCFGGNNGSATVVVSGGFAPYTYSWSPSGGTAATATSLSAGTYTCIITDAGGCTVTQIVNIVSPAALTAVTSQTNVGCNSGSNGSATVIVNGGSPFYSYNWLPSGGTGPIATGLAQGTYTCNITDANGCILSQTFLITEPAVLSATISSTNTNCGQSNGTATLIASGGVVPYSYSWSPAGGNNATANAILAGTYTCTLTDANGCSASYTIIVNDTPAPTLSLVSQTNILCNGNNTGDATVLASGGVGTYTYAWTPAGGINTTASSLLAGTYTCTVTDSAGCTGTQTVTITEPTLLAASATSATILCNGDSTTITVVASGGVGPYTGEGTFTDAAGTYTYIITDANGCTTSTSITVTEPTVLAASSTATAILCNADSATITVSAAGGTGPYTGTGTFTHAAGTFVYTVTDANGCSVTDSITVSEPTALTDSSSATSILCNGGNTTITVTASGGTGPYSGTGTFTQPAGTFIYTVADANGCSITDSVIVAEPTLLVSVVDSTFNPTGCSATDGNIYITTSGGTTGYSYLWSNSTMNEDLTGVAAGTYNCTVTDTNGCTTTVSAALTDPAPPVVTVSIDTTICAANAPYVLTEGNPLGGTWSGTSVSGNTFDPAVGVGSYLLTYTFTAANGCTASASDTMVVDACIGIESIANAAAWSAYPNPTYGNVTLSTTGNENENHLVEIYSSESKLIFSETFMAGNLIQLNMVEHAAGVYMVRIISEHRVSTVRIIKQ